MITDELGINGRFYRFPFMKFLSAFCVFLLPLGSFVSKGTFPTVEAEKLDGTIVEIPNHFAGNFTLIGVASSQKAEEELRTWQAPVYNKFVAKTGLMDDMYDVDICFLPLFTGASRMAKPKVIKKLRQENNPLVSDYLYVYTGEIAPFKDLGMKNKKTPYFYLLDKQGKVIWQDSGSFKQAALDEVEEILNE